MVLGVFDTETTDKDENGNIVPALDATGKKFTTGCYLDELKDYKSFRDKDQMWEYILQKGRNLGKQGKKLHLYGHNIKYDFFNVANLKDKNIRYFNPGNPFIASYIENITKTMTSEELDKWKIYAKNNKIRYTKENEVLDVVDITYRKEVIKFLDSMSLFRMGLGKLGDLIGLRKLEMPSNMGKNMNTKRYEELEKYCKRDCEIILKSLKMLKGKLKDEGVGIKNLCTISQVGINYVINELRKDDNNDNILYRNKAGKLTEYIVRKGFHKLIHDAYRGGYVKVWKVGEYDNCTAIDVNSLYPFCAMKMRFPDLRTERFVKEPLKLYRKDDLLYKIGVSRCMIKNESDAYGLMIFRTESKSYALKKGKYAIGTWTHKELRKASKSGYKIIDIEWSVLWDESINGLSKVYERLYELRNETRSEFDSKFYKEIMNRSIGKFGQYKQSYEVFTDNIENMDKYLNENYRVLKGVADNSYDMFIEDKTEDGTLKKYYNPIIPALVTAEARCYMYDMYKKLPLNQLIYSDTDNIIFQGKGLDKYKINEELGNFKIESDIETAEPLYSKKCIVWGTKSKSIGNNIAISGVFKKSITYKDFSKGKIIVRKMIGLKQSSFNNIGKFTEEIRDLKKQTEDFLEIERKLNEQVIYIDKGVPPRSLVWWGEHLKQLGVLHNIPNIDTFK